MTELSDIFEDFGHSFRKENSLPRYIHNAMNAIENCRTSKIGGHILRCEKCFNIRIQYNSCRNRHCPKCQGDTAKEWIESRITEVIPAPYYHVIFTVPHLLNPVIQRNQKIMYDLMFKASSQTLMQLIGDSNYVGGKAGFISVLHTWGQNMMEHPHAHCLVPGGGLSADENYWVDTKYERYLIPVHVISKVFRANSW